MPVGIVLPSAVLPAMGDRQHDAFEPTTRAAGAINGTLSEPGGNLRTVTDTASQWLISGGDLQANAQTNAIVDPVYTLEALDRQAGALVIMRSLADNSFGGSASSPLFGLFTAVSPATWQNNDVAVMIRAADILAYSGAFSREVAIGTSDTFYNIAIALRESGGFFLFVNQELVYIHDGGATAVLYPGVSSLTAGRQPPKMSYCRAKHALFLPSPLISDGFDDSNGTLLENHLSDGNGHAEGLAGGIGSGGGGSTWIRRTVSITINNNVAEIDSTGGLVEPQYYISTPSPDVVITALMNTGQIATNTFIGLNLRSSSSANYWHVRLDQTGNFILREVVGGSGTTRASAASGFNNNQDYLFQCSADGQEIRAWLDGVNDLYYASAAFNQSVVNHGITCLLFGAVTNLPVVKSFVLYARGTANEHWPLAQMVM